MKTMGGLRKLWHGGQAKVRAIFTFTAGVFNLVRLRNLGPGEKRRKGLVCRRHMDLFLRREFAQLKLDHNQ